MANQEQVDLLARDGVKAWNQWRKDEPTIRPDLSKANLTRAYLPSANLNLADLTRADFSHAYLPGARLYGACLNWTSLGRADLMGAYFGSADLRQANFRGANLSYANLSDANLSGAFLRQANLSGTLLRRTNLSGADLSGAALDQAKFLDANLTGADLSGATCLSTNFSGATLTGCVVYGTSAWDVNLESALQTDLRITPRHKPSIAVDNLEVAQFLYLLLNNTKMRAVLDTITSKVVLILGRFSDERKPILDALREALRRHPNVYIPVLFDFDPQTDKPILETVKTLANLARFVIADLTDPNMVRSELSYITANVPTVPVQPLMQKGAKLPIEYETWVLYRSFLPVYSYADVSQLLANLTESVITPVETHVQARRL